MLVVGSAVLYFVALGMLLPVLPLHVRGDLGGDDVAVGATVGAFALGAVVLRPLAGRIGDRVGRRVLVVGGAAVVGGSILLYPLAGSLAALVGLRILTGVGEAGFFVGAATMVTDLSPDARRAEAISYFSVSVYAGLAFGPTLGEAVLGSDRYGLVWGVAGVLALAGAALGLLTRETGRPAAGPSPRIVHPAGLRPGLMLFLGLVGLSGFTSFTALYVRADLGWSDASLVFLLYGGLILVLRVVAARVPDALGPRTGGTVAYSAAAAGLFVVAGVGTAAGLVLGTVVFAVGMSLLYPTMLSLALVGVPDRERASVIGVTSAFFDLSLGAGGVLLGAVADVGGYRASYAAGAALLVVGLALLRGGFDPRTRREHVAGRPST